MQTENAKPNCIVKLGKPNCQREANQTVKDIKTEKLSRKISKLSKTVKKDIKAIKNCQERYQNRKTVNKYTKSKCRKSGGYAEENQKCKCCTPKFSLPYSSKF